MNGFINERLSECVSYGFSGGPEWNTQVVQLDNGREVRNAQWLYPRHRYSAAYSNFVEQARNELLGAFHSARGRLLAFRFRDWNDFEATAEPLETIAGVAAPVQLKKTYKMGLAESVRLIQAPDVVTVRNASGEPVAGVLDAETGVFTPSSAWADEQHTWNGTFDVWVRFDSDYNAFEITGRSGGQIVASSRIELVEVKR